MYIDLSVTTGAFANAVMVYGYRICSGEIITEEVIMTKVELVNKVADKSGLSKKDSEKAVSAVVAAITEALSEGEKVSLIGFGTFEVRERQAKEGINPRTGEKIQIPARKVPAFKPGKALKESV